VPGIPSFGNLLSCSLRSQRDRKVDRSCNIRTYPPPWRRIVVGWDFSLDGTSPAGDSSGEGPSDEPPSGTAPSERPLSPRIRRLKEKLGKPAPEAEMDEDTRRWVETAAEKHA